MYLTSITVPCLARDAADFDRLLSIWEDDRFFPIRENDRFEPIRLVVVLNRKSEKVEREFLQAFQRRRKLHSVFFECVVFGAGLEGDRDLYARGENEAKGVYGNKAGPNFLFFETMRLVHPYGGFTFQNEVDCYPMNPGWVADLEKLIEQRLFAWVIGSVYTGGAPVGKEIQFHLNGNAVYKAGDPAFINFIDEVWEPRVLEYVDLDPNLAYDCWWSVEQSRATSIVRNTSWKIVSTYSQFFCTNQFLINTLHKETAAEDASYAVLNSNESGQPCIFVHGHASTPLIEEFLSSNEKDLSKYMLCAAEVRQREARQAFEVDQGEQIGLDDGNEISVPWSFPGSARPNSFDEPIFNTSIRLEGNSSKFHAADIDPAGFLGNWHTPAGGDHVWAGVGASGLTVDLGLEVNSVRLKLLGQIASNSEKLANVSFFAFGAQHTNVMENQRGKVVFECYDEEPFSTVSIVIDVEEAIQMPGDARELGYALFRIDIEIDGELSGQQNKDA